MSRFVLTAQLKLQAPTNTRQVVNQMQGQLGNVSVPIQVTGAGKAQKQISQVTAATNKAASAANNMGKSFGLALKRFAAFTVASRAVSLFTNTMANAVDEAIEFQREIVKISQVTGKSVNSLKGLNAEITRLATSLGTSSKELLGATRILAQAGIEAGDLKVALEALAKTTLAPTFEDITKTAEGAVAILAQFGKGVGALKEQLGAINAVAGQFAVESGDLIGAIRRTGGVFKAAGGTLNEFLGLFTSIRATTRESAESIATGLRTILTRIQRPSTIQYLQELGISLTDAEGKFVGAFEAIRRLSKALGDVPAGDLRFIRIAEELGGFRQIGKVIPLLQEFETAERARQAAIAGAASLDKDAATAQQALAVQIQKTKEEFLALVRSITETGSFQTMVKTALGLASAFIKVADALKPLIPLIGVIAATKFAKGIGSFGAGIGSAIKGAQGKSQGGKILAFARGGMVPGSGNRDTVPAMLQPGEFVIRKSSVKKIGADNLAKMNVKGYSNGGSVVKLQATNAEEFGALTISGDGSVASKGKKLSEAAANALRPRVNPLLEKVKAADVRGAEDVVDYGYNKNSLSMGRGPVTFNSNSGMAAWLQTPAGSKFATANRKGKIAVSRENMAAAQKEYAKTAKADITKDVAARKQALKEKAGTDFGMSLRGPFPVRQIGGSAGGLEGAWGKKISDVTKRVLKAGVRVIAKSKMVKELDVPPINTDERKLFNYDNFLEGAQESVEGFMLEGIVGALTNAKIGGGGTNFDFPDLTKKAQKARLKKLFVDDSNFIDKLSAADAKRQLETAQSGEGGLYNKVARDPRLEVALANKGGANSSKDTVPALLTPGEFVINKKSAQSIGYSNLNTMNKKGVTGFNAGGAVGVQTFNKGGGVKQSVASISTAALQKSVNAVTSSFKFVGRSATGLGQAVGKVDMLTFGAVVASAQGMVALFGDKTEKASRTQAAFTIGAEKVIQALTGIFTVIKIFQQYLALVNTFFAKFSKNKTDEKDVQKAEIDAGTVNLKGKSASGAGGAGGGGGKGLMAGAMMAGATASITGKAVDKATTKQKREATTQERVVAKRTENLKKSQDKERMASEDFDSSKQAFRDEKANAKRLKTRKSELERDLSGQDKATGDAAKKKGEADKNVAAAEQQKANADNKLSKAKIKDQKNRDNLTAAQEKQRVAEFNKTQAKQKQAKGVASVDKMQQDQARRSGQIAQLEAKQQHLAKQGGRGKVANIEGGAINEKQLNAKQVDQELARLRGEFQSTNESIKKAEKSVDSYDAEIKKQDTIIKNSKKEQKGLGEAIQKSSAKVSSAENEAAQAADNLRVARDGQEKAEKDLQKATKKQSGTQRKLKSVTSQLNQSSQRQKDLFSKASQAGNKYVTTGEKVKKNEEKLARSRARLTGSTQRQQAAASRSAAATSKETTEKQKNTQKTSRIAKAYRSLRGSLASVDKRVTRSAKKFNLFAAKINRSAGSFGRAGRVVSTLNRKVGMGLVGGVKKADRAVRGLTSRIKRMGASAMGGGKLGRAAGVGAKIGGGIAAAGAIAMQIGQAFGGFVTEMAQRDRERAVKGGDITGAAAAGEEQARGERIQKMFSIGGLVEMFADSKGFNNRMEEDRKNARASAAAEAGAVADQKVKSAVRDGNKSTADALADITANSAKVMREARGTSMENEVSEGRKTAEKEAVLAFAATAMTAEELEEGLKGMSGQTAYSEAQLRKFARQAFAVAEASRALARAQFDNLKVMSAFNKANLGVDQFVNSLQTGSSTLADSIATVEAATKNIGMGAEGRKALNDLRKRTLAASGASPDSAMAGTINRQFDRAESVTTFMGGLQDKLGNIEVSRTDESTAKEQVKTRLLAGVTDPDIRAAIEGAVAGIDNIVGKDNTQIIQEVTKSLGPLKDGALASAKALLKHESTIAKLTQQRRQAELAYIAAQRQAIDMQLGFAKEFEAFGGAKLTSDQKLSANLAKFNLGARDAGVRSLASGSVGDIRNTAQSIRTRLNQQQVDRATGQFRDVQGIDADRIKETNSSIKDLVGFIQSQIQATKEQIAIIEKRNRAEQQSIDALMKGDVSGFIEGQGAAGAASALRAGDAELAGMFSPSQMSAAIQQLRDEGADPATLRRAGEIAAASLGLDDRAGQVLTGTTDDLMELRQRGQDLARVGGEVSQMMADSAMMEVAQAEVAIEQANVIFKNSMARTNAAEERAARRREEGVNVRGANFAKGGTVYANRGIFVPRGTDTVPAMLTPGEFVVNRAAVQRGNNLQILRAMNGNGATVNAGAAGAAALASGGRVGYYQFGDVVQGLGGIFGQALPNLENIFRTFADAVQTLSTLEVGVSVSKPIDVNVRLLNDNILSVIDERIKDVVLDTVAQEIPKYKSTGTGETRRSGSLMNQ